MRRAVSTGIAAGVLGAAVGLVAAARWVLVLSYMDAAHEPTVDFLATHPTLLALSAVGLAVLAIWIVRRAWGLRPVSVALGAISVGCAVLVYTALGAVSSSAQAAGPPWLLLLISSGAATTVVGLLMRARRPAMLAGILTVGLLPFAQAASSLSGDRLAIDGLNYASPPPAPYYLSLMMSLATLGALTGWFAAALRGESEVRAVGIGAGWGAAVAIVAAAAQTVAFFAAMGSGQDPASISIALAALWAVSSAAIALAAREWAVGGSSLCLRFAPAAVISFAAAYAFGAGYGHADYALLKTIHPDMTHAYVHFTADGDWCRTLDQSASTVKAWRAQRFLAAYPYSAYRPAAMLAAAESEFELWHFEEASKILAALDFRYPKLDGYCDILRGITGLAAGDPQAILRPAPSDSSLARWRRTKGAQLAAAAAERLGLPVKARGFHSAYLDYLLAQQKTAWMSEALAFTKSRMESIALDEAIGPASGHVGTVVVRVLAGENPIRGARVALVQPHYDAALPADSRQFTGAWTLPAWNALWGVSDKNGRVVIRDVPYGQYDIVLGLDFRTSPRGYVVSSGARPVAVDREEVLVKPIKLVPALRLRSPLHRQEVSPDVQLEWEDYPGASCYSVTVIDLGDTDSFAPGPYWRARGTTCWARSGIRANSTRLLPDYFLNGYLRLQKGRRYLWLVCAYDPAGDRLSSSEHYFELTETEFRVR